MSEQPPAVRRANPDPLAAEVLRERQQQAAVRRRQSAEVVAVRRAAQAPAYTELQARIAECRRRRVADLCTGQCVVRGGL